MSIIADALKKAREKAGENEKKPVILKVIKEKPRFWTYYIYIVFFVLVLASIAFLSFYNSPAQNPSHETIKELTRPVPITSPASAKDKEVLVSEEPKDNVRQTNMPYSDIPPSSPKTDFDENIVLNGIMYTEDKPLAVINNNIYTEGETVGKFKILEIKNNCVKVRSSEGELIINLKR